MNNYGNIKVRMFDEGGEAAAVRLDRADGEGQTVTGGSLGAGADKYKAAAGTLAEGSDAEPLSMESAALMGRMLAGQGLARRPGIHAWGYFFSAELLAMSAIGVLLVVLIAKIGRL